MSSNCGGGTRSTLEVETSGECSECVGIKTFTNNGDGTSTITLTNGQSYTFQTKGDTGATGATGATGPAGSIPASEAWKTIGGGDTFQNGEAVPGFTTAAANFGASPLQVRKTATGKVAIRGGFAPTAAWISGSTVIVLPLGYRPTVIVYLSVNSTGSIYVTTSGLLVIDGYGSIADIYIPETEFSID